jgi:putative FmdB family regulatory protein
MPLYEYECEACRHRFEVIRKFSDSPLEQCPKCGGAVRKLVAAPAFHLKGSGWYITDYAKKDSGKSGEAPEATEAKPAKPGDEGKAEKPTTGDSSSSSSTSNNSETSSSSDSSTTSGKKDTAKDT